MTDPIDYSAKESARVGKDIIDSATKIEKGEPRQWFLDELKRVIRIIEQDKNRYPVIC